MKEKIISVFIFASIITLPLEAFSDGDIEKPSLTPTEFEQILKESAVNNGEPEQTKINPNIVDSKNLYLSSSVKSSALDSEDLMESLAAEVDTLKSKLKVERSTLLATQSPRKVRLQGAKTIYNYQEGAIFEVNTSVDHITDIELKEGEELTTPPTSGDTVRWNVAVMKSGASTTHVIVKPLEEDIQTNLIIATNKHLYHLKLKSTDFCMPAIGWNYPEDNVARIQEQIKKEESQEPTTRPEDLRFSYEIENDDDVPWSPVRVFDDGSKTFIQMPSNLKTTEAPVLFLIEENEEPVLVNYRVKGDFYIIDRLIQSAELRVGASKKVDIRFDDGKRNFFQRIFS